MMLDLSIQNNEIKGFLPSTVYSHGPKLKMNDKKPSPFQFHFSGVLEAFSMLKKMKKQIVSLDFGDNPIYPISNPDGQDREV